MFPPGMPTPNLSLAIGPVMAALARGARRASPQHLGVAVDIAVRTGCRFVQLSAADPLTKPRTLDRSAVRDIAANIRRRGLGCSGVDLFVPPVHLLSSETVDQAVEALGHAARFAAELAALTDEGRPILSTALPNPDAGIAPGVVASIAAAAASAGGTIADHAWPAGAWHGEGVMNGIDPATVIARGESPASAVAQLADGAGLVACRASDAADDGRVAPGRGSLDPFTYTVAIMTAFRETAPPPIVLDTRGLQLPTQPEALAAFVAKLASSFGVSPDA